MREQQIRALEACIPWAKAEMRQTLPEDSGRHVKCLYRPDPRTAKAHSKSSTLRGPALHSTASYRLFQGSGLLRIQEFQFPLAIPFYEEPILHHLI